MDLPNRKHLRLQTYDYSLPGAYFITICTHKRQHLFRMESCAKNYPYAPISERNGTQAVPYANKISIPPANELVHKWIKETERKFSISIPKYIIMPDHIHLLIFIEEQHADRSLPEIIHWFKTMTTNDYIHAVKAELLPPFHQKIWQKSYYDHVVRNDEDYEQTWQYIENNPTQRLIDIENRQKKKANPNL